MPLGIRLGSSTTAAATTGPASGPRPASSQPATGQTPRLISARSRRKPGGASAITPLGSFAGCLADLSRIMPGSCASVALGATGNSAQCPLFRPGAQSRKMNATGQMLADQRMSALCRHPENGHPLRHFMSEKCQNRT